MKIATYNQTATQQTYISSSDWSTVWLSGTVEPGSSGGPLYNSNHQIIGQIHGGNPSNICTSNDSAFSGRFDVSWTGGGTNSTRLSNWLDPGNTGATTTNTTDIASLYNAPPIASIASIPIDCNTVQFTAGASLSNYTWSLSGDLPSTQTTPVTTSVNYLNVSTTTGGNVDVYLYGTSGSCNAVTQGWASYYPYQGYIYFTSPMPVIGYFSQMSAYVNPVYGAYNYKWYINGSLVAQGYDLTNFSSAYYNGPYCGEHNSISVVAETDCGTYTIASDYFDWDCSSGYSVKKPKDSLTVMLEDATTYNTFQVFPNPAKDVITVYVPVNKQSANITLINATGTAVKATNGVGLIKLPVANVANGLYIVEIKQEGIITRKKVIVQH
ncbi:MAG: T9SS type A sorting domain-containing protein [Bacteroidetes bacterium]|nr:T9SS type A sorting domain-containing protein [Bacteroidota bacterium]